MKKIYLAPQLLMVKVSGQRILAGSPVNSSGLDGFKGYGGVDDGSGTPGSRSYNSEWEDEDEEENGW